ncbi:unnamed protein product [Moneuplotes crassus]|uniref:Uncharacterized protein n=1 Tax=Euplotes crassus TaxID=5936 RepID=A0AAD2D0C9_EUPCR|nr:unnamed protein product [Moneuplotes crassus]
MLVGAVLRYANGVLRNEEWGYVYDKRVGHIYRCPFGHFILTFLVKSWINYWVWALKDLLY